MLPARAVGLPKDSVANVSQFVTIDRDYLEERAGTVSAKTLARVEAGIRLVLDI